MTTEKTRSSAAERQRRYALRHPERVKARKQAYYASERGKAQKRKEDAALVASGKRAEIEARREAKPLSEARRQARLAYDVLRRTGRAELDKIDRWVAREAVRLARLRTSVTGFKWHVDHIVPVSKGGTSHPSNLQVVPAYWNRSKSNKHSERMFGARA